MTSPVKKFQGEFRFLSNFFPAAFTFMDRTYPTSEHFYQAAKASVPGECHRITLAPSPGEAKRRGGKCVKRDDWEQIKMDVMRLALRLKFTQNPSLAERLVHTGQAGLIEGNTWGDTFWGVDARRGGENKLGVLLMDLRGQLP